MKFSENKWGFYYWINYKEWIKIKKIYKRLVLIKIIRPIYYLESIIKAKSHKIMLIK